MAWNVSASNESAAAPRPYALRWLAHLDHLYSLINYAAVDRRVRWGLSGIPHRAHGAAPVPALISQLRSILTAEPRGAVASGGERGPARRRPDDAEPHGAVGDTGTEGAPARTRPDDTEPLVDALSAAVSIGDELRAARGVHQAVARVSGRDSAYAEAVALAHADAVRLVNRVDVRAEHGSVAALVEHVGLMGAAAYGTVIVGDLLDDATRHRGWGWMLAIANPRCAQRTFVAAPPAPPGAGRCPGLGDDRATTVLHGSARSAASGQGAPLWQSDAAAHAALASRGWITP